MGAALEKHGGNHVHSPVSFFVPHVSLGDNSHAFLVEGKSIGHYTNSLTKGTERLGQRFT